MLRKTLSLWMVFVVLYAAQISIFGARPVAGDALQQAMALSPAPSIHALPRTLESAPTHFWLSGTSAIRLEVKSFVSVLANCQNFSSALATAARGLHVARAPPPHSFLQRI